jgi:hypothetical protein
MELTEMLAVSPGDYLSKGFFDDRGEFREGINGFSSLAMAYRCREEGLRPEKVQHVTSLLEKLAERNVAAVDENPEKEMDRAATNELNAIRKDATVAGSATLKAIFDAALPWVKNWKNYAAFVLHLERVLAQLAIISSPEPDASIEEG